MSAYNNSGVGSKVGPKQWYDYPAVEVVKTNLDEIKKDKKEEGLTDFEILGNDKTAVRGQKKEKDEGFDLTDKQKLENLIRQVAGLTLRMNEKDERIQAQDEQIKAQGDRIENLEKENHEKGLQLEKNNREIRELKNLNEEQERTIQRIQNEMKGVRKENERLKNEKEAKEEELERVKEANGRAENSKTILFNAARKLTGDLRRANENYIILKRQLHEICDQKKKERDLFKDWFKDYTFDNNPIRVNGEIADDDPEAGEKYILCLMQVIKDAVDSIKDLKSYEKSFNKIANKLLGEGNHIPHDVEGALDEFIEDRENVIDNYKQICRALDLPENISINDLMEKIEELKTKPEEEEVDSEEEIEARVAQKLEAEKERILEVQKQQLEQQFAIRLREQVRPTQNEIDAIVAARVEAEITKRVNEATEKVMEEAEEWAGKKGGEIKELKRQIELYKKKIERLKVAANMPACDRIVGSIACIVTCGKTVGPSEKLAKELNRAVA